MTSVAHLPASAARHVAAAHAPSPSPRAAAVPHQASSLSLSPLSLSLPRIAKPQRNAITSSPWPGQRAAAVGVRCGLKPQTLRGGISGKGLKFGVVVGLFNDMVTKPLLSGALETFERHGVKDGDVQVVQVPGSFEIPVVTQQMAKSGKFDAVLCIGAVVRGSTTHYDAVANNAASGILSASLSSGVPCIFGVLTCETMEQAMDRAGGKLGNKGSETAVTAIEMASLMKML